MIIALDVVERGVTATFQQKMFDDSLRAALSLEEIRELVQRLGLDPAQVTRTSDRHWTWNSSIQAPETE